MAPDIGVNEVDSDVVLQVQALDRDHGRNAKITYSIVEGRFWKKCFNDVSEIACSFTSDVEYCF